ncbi:hypothetical protein D3C81_358590 [compost metagenome]
MNTTEGEGSENVKTSDYVKESLEIVAPLMECKKAKSGGEHLSILLEFLIDRVDRLYDCLLTIQADLDIKNDQGGNQGHPEL